VFLFHFRSALIPILTLPHRLVISFIPMYYLNVSSNIMSLGGLALAIGVLVVRRHRHGRERLSASVGAAVQPSERERVRILINAAKQSDTALFFSLLIIVVSFFPYSLWRRRKDACSDPWHGPRPWP
jgi:Cu(I)/Ag(I) efflux system membrane protein CusA/SilA